MSLHLRLPIAHRPIFAGIENVDFLELHRALKKYGPVDLVYLRCHLDGTLFTQDGRAKFTSRSDFKMSLVPCHHRAWVCPHFQACRAHLTPEQLTAIESLPRPWMAACLAGMGDGEI